MIKLYSKVFPLIIVICDFKKLPPRRSMVQIGVNANYGQAPQAPIDPLAKQVTYAEFWAVFQMLAQSMTA